MRDKNEHFFVTKSFGLNNYYFNRFYDAFSLLLLTTTAFLIPFVLGHPQFLVGTIVNLLLIEASLYLDFKKTIPIITMPSLGALSRAILFGPLTIFLIYMIPFIWIANTILVLVIKVLHFKFKKNLFVVGVLGAVLKTAFLFATAFTLFSFGIVPKQFLTAFGINQFLTAFSALVLIYPTVVLRKKNFRLKQA